MPYRAPLTDFGFILDHVVGFSQVSDTPLFAEATSDTVSAVLAEAGKLAENLSLIHI